jgi:hypothetical protein
MGMRNQHTAHARSSQTRRENNTPLDDMLRQHLRNEAQDAPERGDALLQAILYRAQFEVEQLPPQITPDPVDETDADALTAPPPSALMHNDDHPKHKFYVTNHFNRYRELMDVKLFRALGACGTILSLNR